ncbi:hypothetical protein LJR084_008128 [Variovorax sp. LjRoot84]|uniref:hypothetical protein n=1 Tax=Variovorax sp. LjRoot84 TaxID=3342340 RepID=UPI003ECCD78D
MAEPVEHIPDEDVVSRLIDAPHKVSADDELKWECVFEFPAGQPESVVWRKYKPAIDDVHRSGCERQKTKRVDKPAWTYKGAISSAVGSIRAIRNARGHGFQVLHEPSEGQEHAEVAYLVGGDALQKNDKTELKSMLRDAFADQDPHDCSEG